MASAVPLWTRLLACDDTSFFSVVPADVLTLLVPFIWHFRPRVRDPTALQFERCAVMLPTFQMGLYLFCFDSADNIVVPLYENRAVRVFCKLSGQPLRDIGATESHHMPIACAMDSRGRLFVSESGAGRVHVFCADGHIDRLIGPTRNNARIKEPRGLALSIDEKVLYVAEGEADVLKSYCVDTCVHLTDFGAAFLKQPIGVAVLSDGHIAVSSAALGTVHIFTSLGAVTHSFGASLLRAPQQIAVDANDNLYVANCDDYNVIVYTRGGRVVHCLGARGDDYGQFNRPVGIAINSAGSVAVSDYGRKRIQLFKSA